MGPVERGGLSSGCSDALGRGFDAGVRQNFGRWASHECRRAASPDCDIFSSFLVRRSLYSSDAFREELKFYSLGQFLRLSRQ